MIRIAALTLLVAHLIAILASTLIAGSAYLPVVVIVPVIALAGTLYLIALGLVIDVALTIRRLIKR